MSETQRRTLSLRHPNELATKEAVIAAPSTTSRKLFAGSSAEIESKLRGQAAERKLDGTAANDRPTVAPSSNKGAVASLEKPWGITKIPHYLLLILLTLGASLIIGLLSFGGLFALWPSIPLASLAFILSVAYEGEIYFQNIKGALSKLFDNNNLKLAIARSYLLTYFPHHLTPKERPAFFNDYRLLLKQLHAFEHPIEQQSLTAEQRIRKKKIEQQLLEMESYFADQLNASYKDTDNSLPKDTRELRAYLSKYPIKQASNKISFISLPDTYKALVASRTVYYRASQVFSGLAGLFMGFGTTYLLMETFAIIPFLAVLPATLFPFLIVPMAIISGIAYGLLTHNTITNMISNNSIQARFKKLREEFKTSGLTPRNAFMGLSTVILGGLAIALTLCTAGTWWTIIQEAKPLFTWMSKIPRFIMGVINPIITSLSALAFNLENSSESLDVIEEATRDNANRFKEAKAQFQKKMQQLRARENTAPLLNPFRLRRALTIGPLRLSLFLGHLISIGVTADRVPGFSKLGSASLGFISEFFEDLHYFMQHTGPHRHDTRTLLAERLDEKHAHQHDRDIPTRILLFIATPITALATLWSYAFSQLNPIEHRLTLAQAFKQNSEKTAVVKDDLERKTNVITVKAIQASAQPSSMPKRSETRAPEISASAKPSIKPTPLPIAAQKTTRISNITHTAEPTHINEPSITIRYESSPSMAYTPPPTLVHPQEDDNDDEFEGLEGFACLCCPPKAPKGSTPITISLQKILSTRGGHYGSFFKNMSSSFECSPCSTSSSGSPSSLLNDPVQEPSIGSHFARQNSRTNREHLLRTPPKSDLANNPVTHQPDDAASQTSNTSLSAHG